MSFTLYMGAISFTDKIGRMLCFFSSWRDSFRVGWGGKSSPKQSNWSFENTSLEVDVNVRSHRLYLIFVCRSFYSNPSNGRGFKQLPFQASLGETFYLFFLCILYLVFATSLKRVFTFLCYTTYFMMTQREWGNSKWMATWHWVQWIHLPCDVGFGKRNLKLLYTWHTLM